MQFERNVEYLNDAGLKQTLKGIRHGVERETLRVNDKGSMSQHPHPAALGSALTNSWITTDFSESLLEFITPPEVDSRTTIKQLKDIHKYTLDNIGEELLWPMSMPCFVDKNTDIPIARYGTSNVAKMKEVYRKGLHNRYGSMMQVISGVHFNFSLPDDFWQQWCDKHGGLADKQGISSQYFSITRHFKRLSWVIPYLFGASPALCGSFINHKKVNHPFQKLAKGTLYLPYATSLRMSDLGYTSSAQSSLRICYNELDSYVTSLRGAINQPASQYDSIPAGENNDWQQLNKNILQIENELYSSIRPKQVARSLEKPSDALQSRGVSYLEVRCMDVNPFSLVGIEANQMDFLDVFLLYCLLLPPVDFTDRRDKEWAENFVKVVLSGREPKLSLINESQEQSMQSWLHEIFEGLKQVAEVLDSANNTGRYSKSVRLEWQKCEDPTQTYSALWMNKLLDDQIDNSVYGMKLAKEYKQGFSDLAYTNITQQDFREEARLSVQTQAKTEATDSVNFAAFIANYFKAS